MLITNEENKAKLEQKINAYLTANENFHATYKKLTDFEEEITRQKKILDALEYEVEQLRAECKQSINSDKTPDAKVYSQLKAKESELSNKAGYLSAFFADSEKGKNKLLVELSRSKQRLIHAHSELMEFYGYSILQEVIAENGDKIAQAFLAITKSKNFMQEVRNQEDTLRQDIEPNKLIMAHFTDVLQSHIKQGQINDDFILSHKLSPEINNIEAISPFKAMQIMKGE